MPYSVLTLLRPLTLTPDPRPLTLAKPFPAITLGRAPAQAELPHDAAHTLPLTGLLVPAACPPYGEAHMEEGGGGRLPAQGHLPGHQGEL